MALTRSVTTLVRWHAQLLCLSTVSARVRLSHRLALGLALLEPRQLDQYYRRIREGSDE